MTVNSSSGGGGGNDGSRVIASAQWSTDAGGGTDCGNGGSGGSSNGGSSSNGGGGVGNPGLYLKEFAHKFKMPRLVRIVKGHYLHLGGSSALSGGGGNGQVRIFVECKSLINMKKYYQFISFNNGTENIGSLLLRGSPQFSTRFA